MPLSPPVLASGFLVPSLLSVGHIGTGMPKFAFGIATGVCLHLTTKAKVTTVDTGSLGVGTSLAPLLIPPQLLLPFILNGFRSQSILGPISPLTALGISQGLSTGLLALSLVQTNHPVVGAGAGVARIVGPSAVASMITGFSIAGMNGGAASKMATALGIALDGLFGVLLIPIPIVGTVSPTAGAGTGSGSVI